MRLDVTFLIPEYPEENPIPLPMEEVISGSEWDRLAWEEGVRHDMGADDPDRELPC